MGVKCRKLFLSHSYFPYCLQVTESKKEYAQTTVASIGLDKLALQKKLDAHLNQVRRPLALITN